MAFLEFHFLENRLILILLPKLIKVLLIAIYYTGCGTQNEPPIEAEEGAQFGFHTLYEKYNEDLLNETKFKYVLLKPYVQ